MAGFNYRMRTFFEGVNQVFEVLQHYGDHAEVKHPPPNEFWRRMGDASLPVPRPATRSASLAAGIGPGTAVGLTLLLLAAVLTAYFRPFDFVAERVAFRGQLIRRPATVVECAPTKASEDGGRIYSVGLRYTVGRESFDARSFSVGRRYDPGDPVRVEHRPGRPSVARLVGGRASETGRFGLAMTLLWGIAGGSAVVVNAGLRWPHYARLKSCHAVFAVVKGRTIQRNGDDSTAHYVCSIPASDGEATDVTFRSDDWARLPTRGNGIPLLRSPKLPTVVSPVHDPSQNPEGLWLDEDGTLRPNFEGHCKLVAVAVGLFLSASLVAYGTVYRPPMSQLADAIFGKDRLDSPPRATEPYAPPRRSDWPLP